MECLSDVSSLVVVMLLMLLTWPVPGQQRQVLEPTYDARQEETAKVFFSLLVTKNLTHTNRHCLSWRSTCLNRNDFIFQENGARKL